LRTAVGPDYDLKVIDFGLSIVCQHGVRETGRVGTPYYIAPEVLARDYDKSCDMWSMGVVLFILLCGYPPFWGDVDRKIFARIKKGQYSMIGPQWANVSDAAKNLLSKLLCPEDSRLTALQALDDPWILEEGSMNTGKFSKALIQRVRRFSVQTPLKKAALRSIAQIIENRFTMCAAQTFELFDLNRDGVLSESDLMEAALLCGSQLSPAECSRIIHACNNSKTDCLTRADFFPAMLTRSVFLRTENLVASFQMLNSSETGHLTVADLKKHMPSFDAIHTVALCGAPHLGVSMREFLQALAGNT
jgi:calcium-dependent protein kinase